MLIFFIHGVATRDVKYADKLKENIKKLLLERDESPFCFYSSFWGNALSDMDRMWNSIEQDLRLVKQRIPESDSEKLFQYKKFRETFLAEFVGDMFTYLNEDRGYSIRQTLHHQLASFIDDNPQETELGIVTHSLGSVIFWDTFFSNRFENGDPAFAIRDLIQGLAKENSHRQVYLRNVTTMGSPILFFNTMLRVDPENVKAFAIKSEKSLKWLNIIHASDIISYPLRSSFGLTDHDALQVDDVYFDTNNNPVTKISDFLLNALKPILGWEIASKVLEHMAMVFDMGPSHTEYWGHSSIAELIVKEVFSLEAHQTSGNKECLEEIIHHLQEVPGMTVDKSRQHIDEEPVNHLSFSDGSGNLKHIVNAFGVHHVYLLDKANTCRFSGFVGWVHNRKLKEAIKFIESSWC